jgi:type III pantothenate kinase
MLLVVDVGNTETVLGLYEGERLRFHWRLSTERGRTPDEWGVAIAGLFQIAGISPKAVEAAAMASVVPPLTGAIAGMIERQFGMVPLQVGPGVKTGIKILYDNPLEVGADRIVNSVAAWARVGGAAIIVDFGTATTFDVLSANAEYLGGVIVPGLLISADSLAARAARLPRVEVRKPPRVIGRNTVHSMQSGLYHGYASLVNGMISLIRSEMGGRPAVIVTGGLHGQLVADLEGVDHVDPCLTLEGLRIVHSKNTTE